MQPLLEIVTFPLALLKLMAKQEGLATNPLLGVAKRAGVETSVFNLPAHRVLLVLIEHAPSPETIAREFLTELGQCGIPGVTELGALLRAKYSRRADWVQWALKCKVWFGVLSWKFLQRDGRPQSVSSSRSPAVTSPALHSSRATT